jgi:hypothetical protein
VNELKKFIGGILCGILISFCTVAYAEKLGELSLFPVAFKFNDKNVSLGEHDVSLNYEGKTYVPLRFIAEKLGAAVSYDPASSTVSVLYNESNRPVLRDPSYPSVAIGNLKPVKDGEKTRLGGYLLFDSSDKQIQAEQVMQMRIQLSFYDQNQKQIGITTSLITFSGWADNPFEVVPFNVWVEGDMPHYDHAELTVLYLGKPLHDFH